MKKSQLQERIETLRKASNCKLQHALEIRENTKDFEESDKKELLGEISELYDERRLLDNLSELYEELTGDSTFTEKIRDIHSVLKDAEAKTWLIDF